MDAAQAAGKWLHTEEDGKLDKNIWAGGDDRGPGLASKAIAQGRIAAEAAHAELRGERDGEVAPQREAVRSGTVKTDFYAKKQRVTSPRQREEEWLADPESEVDRTISYEQACEEASRCMSCGLCFDCQQCFVYCNVGGFTRIDETSPGNYFVFALDDCEGCGKCIEICPSGYLGPRAGG
jgi:ferredoxin